MKYPTTIIASLIGLHVAGNGTSSLTYGPVNLSNVGTSVTGVLPNGVQQPQNLVGDVTGVTNSNTVVGIEGKPVPTPVAAGVLTWNGGSMRWNRFVGDVTSFYGDPINTVTVTGLQTRPVAATAPATGQSLVWSGSQWAPASVGAIPTAFTVTGGTSVPANGSLVAVGAAGLTPAAGTNLSITMTFDFSSPDNVPADEFYGVSLGVVANVVDSHTLTVPLNVNANATGQGQATLVWRTAATGSPMSVFCVATSPVVAMVVGCHILLEQVN